MAVERDRSSSATESGSSGDDQRSPKGSDFDAENMFTAEYDGLVIARSPPYDEFSDIDDLEDIDDIDDFEDFEDFEDDDFSSGGGGPYLPRRVPYVPSTRPSTITVPPWYGGTTATTEATMTEATTTVEETSASASSSITTTTTGDTTTVPDTTPPSAPVINGPVGITNDPLPTFAGSGEEGSTVTVTEGASALCTATVTGEAWSCDASRSLADGLHSIATEAVDAAGNRATGPTVSLTVDTQRPAEPVISSPTDGSGTSEATPMFNGTGEDGSTVTVAEGTTGLCTATVALGAWSCAPTLTAGPHLLTPMAVDASGNLTVGAPVQVTVDPSSPVITSPADGSGTPDTTPTITGTGADGSTVSVSVGDSVRCTAVVAQGTWSCDATELTEGTYLFTTAAGTVPGTSIRLTIDGAAPVVNEPANGSAVTATTLTSSAPARTATR